jgi:basic membrane lipoprotein Med (substrate-binding protein (PBP1-ABC) superfamily)
MKMRRRKIRLLVLISITLVALTLAACGEDNEPEPTATPEPTEQPVFRVAAVAPSAQDDLAFTQSMYQALLRVQQELGEENFEFDFQGGTFVVGDAEIAIRQWVETGDYDLIIAHGSQYGEVIQTLAPEFPEVSFAWGTDVNTFGLDNVFAYEAAAAEGGYVNGVMAASLTESNIIGVVGPIEIGDAKLYTDGFVAGATASNPDVEVNVTYIESFSDVPLATQAAEAFVADGADILTGSSQMVVGPIAVAIENGNVLWFGTQSNQADISEDIGVAFQVYHWEVILLEMVDSIEAGTLGGTSFTLDLANKGLVIEFNESYDMSDELAALADETIQGIIDGDIEIPVE